MPRIFWPATLSLSEHGVKSIRDRSQDEEKRWRLEGVEGWKRRGGSLISPDKKPCICCVRRRSPPKNSGSHSRKSSVGCGLRRRHRWSGPPQERTTWELVCHETPVLCLAFLPAPIPAGAGPGGRGRDWGEVVSLPVHVLLQPQGAEWEQREEGCTSSSTWKQTAHS